MNKVLKLQIQKTNKQLFLHRIPRECGAHSIFNFCNINFAGSDLLVMSPIETTNRTAGSKLQCLLLVCTMSA